MKKFVLLISLLGCAAVSLADPETFRSTTVYHFGTEP